MDIPQSASGGPPLRDEPACRLFLRLLSEIEPLIAGFQLSQEEAEEVVRELLAPLVHDWERLSSRELWILVALRRSCQRRIRLRQAKPSPPA
jgi:hypothetical protein